MKEHHRSKSGFVDKFMTNIVRSHIYDKIKNPQPQDFTENLSRTTLLNKTKHYQSQSMERAVQFNLKKAKQADDLFAKPLDLT